MTPEQILGCPARILSEGQRRAYFEAGFLAAAGLIPEEWLRRLGELSNAFLEQSRSVAASNEAFDLGPEHGAGFAGKRYRPRPAGRAFRL